MPRLTLNYPAGDLTAEERFAIAANAQLGVFEQFNSDDLPSVYKFGPGDVDVVWVKRQAGSKSNSFILGTLEGVPHRDRKGRDLTRKMDEVCKRIKQHGPTHPRQFSKFINLNFAERDGDGWVSA